MGVPCIRLCSFAPGKQHAGHSVIKPFLPGVHRLDHAAAGSFVAVVVFQNTRPCCPATALWPASMMFWTCSGVQKLVDPCSPELRTRCVGLSCATGPARAYKGGRLQGSIGGVETRSLLNGWCQTAERCLGVHKTSLKACTLACPHLCQLKAPVRVGSVRGGCTGQRLVQIWWEACAKGKSWCNCRAVAAAANAKMSKSVHTVMAGQVAICPSGWTIAAITKPVVMYCAQTAG